MKNAIKVFSILCASVTVLALACSTASAQKATPAAFSFDVYGDSRSMMYLPYKEEQEAEARELMVDMFELVLPQKVAATVIRKNVKLTYESIQQLATGAGFSPSISWRGTSTFDNR